MRIKSHKVVDVWLFCRQADATDLLDIVVWSGRRECEDDTIMERVVIALRTDAGKCLRWKVIWAATITDEESIPGELCCEIIVRWRSAVEDKRQIFWHTPEQKLPATAADTSRIHNEGVESAEESPIQTHQQRTRTWISRLQQRFQCCVTIAGQAPSTRTVLWFRPYRLMFLLELRVCVIKETSQLTPRRVYSHIYTL